MMDIATLKRVTEAVTKPKRDRAAYMRNYRADKSSHKAGHA